MKIAGVFFGVETHCASSSVCRLLSKTRPCEGTFGFADDVTGHFSRHVRFVARTQMATTTAPLGMEVRDPPNDGISSLVFGRKSGALLVTSWDSTTRVYDVDTVSGASTVRHRIDSDFPVLDACFAGADDRAVVTGGLCNAVTYHDLASGTSSVVGTHEDAVRCVVWDEETGVIFSASWDGTMRAWDPRLPAETRLVRSASLPGKAHAMALSRPEDASRRRLVLATSGGKMVAASPSAFLEGAGFVLDRESTLAHQTRALACAPDGESFVNASVEGRVAWERFAESEGDKAQQYAFKCHRTKASEEGDELAREAAAPRPFGVNAVAFHPFTGAFATGGGDGYVCVWDGLKKKRLWQSARYPAGVACLAFSEDGGRIAVAVSRERRNEKAFSDDVEATPRTAFSDAVFVRRVEDSEVTPKRK